MGRGRRAARVRALPPALEVGRSAGADPVPFVAVLCAAVGLALLLPRATSRTALLLGGLAMLAAVALAPVTVVALTGPAFALWTASWRRSGDQRVEALVRTTTLVLGLVGLAFAVAWIRPGGGGPPVGAQVAPVVAVVVLVAALAGLALRRVRPLALSGLTLAGGIAVPGTAPATLVLLTAVVACLLVAGVADAAVRYRPTRLLGRDVRRVGPVLGAVAAVGLVAAVLPAWLPSVSAVPAVAAPRELAAGPASDRPAPSASPSTGPSSRPVVPTPSRTTADPAPTPTVAPDEATLRASRQLAENPNVRTTGAARSDLGTGRVDARLLTLLAVLADRHDLTVDAFPQTSSGLDRLTARITRVDDGPAEPSSPAAAELAAVIDAQVSPYRSYSVWFPAAGDTPAALVVSVPAATS
ncbi:hypothetical protein G7075_19045 [Phycicoccus sp. HDW14]|uniref:hypothetical protein n=1 Tax=Phycicoccus sp. HDW14 TaxID=2714941 RepID=UPI00140CD1B7|nr:hypothetical protein [Phycicoccus sp. HDW14]QIM22747.1 hypothetical protein G7075_19045 [Phycicoccus sp. HDW14]